MKPVTDRYKVSRAKLAYIIDATAAPICIIAPISSWAAAVGSYLKIQVHLTLNSKPLLRLSHTIFMPFSAFSWFYLCVPFHWILALWQNMKHWQKQGF